MARLKYDNIFDTLTADPADAANLAFRADMMVVLRKVFQDHELARGAMRWRGQKVEPAAIRRTALFAVEGEMDDICAIGQTMAALDLCVGLRPSMRRYHLQTGVGHYGVFSGRRWAHEIYPRVRTMIHAHST